EWLSPIDFQAIQQNHLAKRVPGTGHWLPEEVEFQQWTAGEIKILWCPGNPGVGKTMLASTAVDHLQNQLSHPGVAVACIFFDYNTSSSQSITDIFGSVIRQLLIDSSSIPDSLQSLHTSFQSRHSPPTSLRVMAETLRAQIQLYSCVYLVVDALDECPVDIRDDFISTIRSLTESGPLSVLITSRDILTIAQEFTNETRIDVRAHDDDVLSYITYRIEQDKKLKRIVKEDAVLKKDIVTQVTEKAAGMFLLVRLHLDSLASKNNRQALRQALATLPKDIHRSYDETMARIMAQGEDDANLACQVFLWLTYSQKRLTVEELQCAVAISPGMTVMDPDAITDIDILMSVCTGLVIIEDHWTGQPYFELSGKPLFSDLFAHFHIVAICITCLAFEGLKIEDEDKVDKFFWASNYLLLQYSAQFWGYHAGQCENMLCSTPRMAALLQDHLENNFKVPSPLSTRFPGMTHDYHSGCILGRFGLLQLTSMLVNRGVPVNSKDQEKRTVLFYAVQKGHSTTAEFLLDLPGINPDVADRHGRTPLSHAAGSCYTQIVDLLCCRADVNPNSNDLFARPPLYYAIYYNHGDPDSPLKLAANCGHVDIVDLLLKYPDIDPNWKGAGYPPLRYAIMSGHLKVIDLLLQHSDIQPNLMSGREGQEWIMPPLTSAVLYEYVTKGMVERLLQHPDVYVNCRDSAGRTPLLWATFSKDENVVLVEVLLQHPHIQPDIPDHMGRTPLMTAAMKGYNSSFSHLFQSHKVTRDLVSSDNVGLLAYAACGGRRNIVDQVLALNSSSGCKDCHRCTPLSYAAMEGYQDVVQLLLKHDDFRVRYRHKQAAADWLQRPTVIHLLLPDQKNLDPSSRHRQHFTTLIDYALRWGYTGIAALLHQHVDTEDTLGADSWK
ncbi:ankyrin repeat-containing domain protein, partial [Mycena floridula]